MMMLNVAIVHHAGKEDFLDPLTGPGFFGPALHRVADSCAGTLPPRLWIPGLEHAAVFALKVDRYEKI